MSDDKTKKPPVPKKDEVKTSLEATFPASDPPSYWASGPKKDSDSEVESPAPEDK